MLLEIVLIVQAVETASVASPSHNPFILSYFLHSILTQNKHRLLLLALVPSLKSKFLRNQPPRDRVQEPDAVLFERLAREVLVDLVDGAVRRAAILHPALVADPVRGFGSVQARFEREQEPAELCVTKRYDSVSCVLRRPTRIASRQMYEQHQTHLDLGVRILIEAINSLKRLDRLLPIDVLSPERLEEEDNLRRAPTVQVGRREFSGEVGRGEGARGVPGRGERVGAVGEGRVVLHLREWAIH